MLLCFILGGCSHWTKTNTALEAAFIATTGLDWHQTMSITAECAELNPVIGSCDGGMPPNAYFPVAFVLHRLRFRGASLLRTLVVLPLPMRLARPSLTPSHCWKTSGFL